MHLRPREGRALPKITESTAQSKGQNWLCGVTAQSAHPEKDLKMWPGWAGHGPGMRSSKGTWVCLLPALEGPMSRRWGRRGQ